MGTNTHTMPDKIDTKNKSVQRNEEWDGYGYAVFENDICLLLACDWGFKDE